MAKFSFGCFHKIVSRSEMKQLTLNQFEVDMLTRCLNGVDKFFGGYEHLLLTVSKLAKFANNWKSFAEAGFVQILMSLVISEKGCIQIYAAQALLNMIPEPVVAELLDKAVKLKSKCICHKPLTNQATVMVTSSTTFMDFVKFYKSTGVCGDILHGIKVLTQPLENPGEYSIMY